MTKLRNSVAHGQYEYDEETDSYIFHNYYKGTERFRTTITRKELEKFLLESQLIETVLTPTHILNIIKYESEQNDTELSEINRYIQSTKINPRSNFSLQKYQNMVMGIIDKLNMSEHDCGRKLLNYDYMLYPQYEDHVEKTIDLETWIKMQEKASENYNEYLSEKARLENGDEYAFPASKKVAAHWRSIIDGNVPFGFKVK